MLRFRPEGPAPSAWHEMPGQASPIVDSSLNRAHYSSQDCSSRLVAEWCFAGVTWMLGCTVVAEGRSARGWGSLWSRIAVLSPHRGAAGGTGTKASAGRHPDGTRSRTTHRDGDWRRSSIGFWTALQHTHESRARTCRGGCLRGIAEVESRADPEPVRVGSDGEPRDNQWRGIHGGVGCQATRADHTDSPGSPGRL
jgi:hypothetical protein